DYAGYADSAAHDQYGNQIDTHYATQAELQSVDDALDLKAMQNPGICQKCPIFPNDIVIDAVANTLTIATIKNGQTISALNPIRFFTDGN
ncbi:hypothetical protein M3M33_14570, partial [Loigolactobacillus coryniformis]|uniref:hypothetical protein n=1 Tax=Loigolactobacillus coryniformis TaxID=1610 RepID=UPI00201B33BC